jgi:predicted phosphodiesterase
VRYLILSDIHANWESLQAVLAHADGMYDQALCCGDLIDYGADPNAVTDWVSANVGPVVRGNHDKACVGLADLERFNSIARAAALWTQRELTPENASYVRSLLQGPLLLDGFQAVHGSPVNEDEYLLEAADAGPVFCSLQMQLTFFGHTHVQGGFIWNRERVETIGRTETSAGEQTLVLDPDRLYLINPGSVGQPRDRDPRASYAIYNFHEHFVTFYRVAYDVNKAQDKIRRAGLPSVLADCLAQGRW